eukprot:TRINITY_DN12205_c0_g1_i1.p1 TRINITY_DN12205_c0_g1~~TRINITY_DN12205_c0_g1_i1.p1  ORF type:complete len:142 (+),score=41.57 TRINITY_DN12205_c0_g1_i1:64-489(+)
MIFNSHGPLLAGLTALLSCQVVIAELSLEHTESLGCEEPFATQLVQTGKELKQHLNSETTAANEQFQVVLEEQAQNARAALLALDAKEEARMRLRDAGERAEAEAIAGLVKNAANWIWNKVQGAPEEYLFSQDTVSSTGNR